MALQRLTTLILVILFNLAALACSASRLPSSELLGLRVGMDKASAQAHLNEISDFIRSEGRNQELWKLKDASRFETLAVGYSGDQIRYVTAFVNKAAREKPLPFSSIGDIRVARSEIAEPHFRYIWDVPVTKNQPACSVNVYGDNPEFVTMYTLVRRSENESKSIEEDD